MRLLQTKVFRIIVDHGCRCKLENTHKSIVKEYSSILNHRKNTTVSTLYRRSCRFYSLEASDKQAAASEREKFENVPAELIRNFSIIAHVDHGKSTLADRLLEITGTMKADPSNKQVLDRLQVEKDRGITVKAQSVSIWHKSGDKEYLLNLIDTPGHVDFSNEVFRSLSACQGVLLLVDANQGVQAQTVANFYLAFSKDLVILPVLNKIDLKNAEPEVVANQLQALFDIDPSDVLKISAKTGQGVPALLEAIIGRIPAPQTDRDLPLRALIYDSWFDRYKGAIVVVYLQTGQIRVGDHICSAHTGIEYTVKSVGVLRPHQQPTNKLSGGQVGYIQCNMRTTQEAHIGDTLYLKSQPVTDVEQLTPAKPMVFAGVFPLDQSQNPVLRTAIEKLTLNDPAVSVKQDTSPALGQGWRLGFLGLLHMEVFNQRLEQEHNAHAIITAPSVTYKLKIKGKKNQELMGGETIYISNPAHWPHPQIIEEMSEPIVLATIITPDDYLGKIMSLCNERRGIQQNISNIDNKRIMLQFVFPLNEIIVNFHDGLKAISSGFASFDYEDAGYSPTNLVKLSILLNGSAVDELSIIVHHSKVDFEGRALCRKLVEIIPRQMFQIAIQATVNGKIIARETLKAYRKDVTAKLYGGDVTRRTKLLKQQAEGKKKMKMIANIQIPRDTFIEILKKE